MTLEQRITALAQAIGADIKTLFSTSGGSPAWGYITGALSNQTDLQAAIDAKQTADADLTAIAALTGTTGLLKKTAADTWALETAEYLPLSGGTLTGAITFAGAQTWPTFNQNTSGSAGSVAWSGVSSKPTTLAGYGITDAAASSHVGSTGTAHGVVTSLVAGFMSSADKTKLDGIAASATANAGTVTSVSMTAPTGLSISGSPVTTSGTLAVSLAAGYAIPTTSSQTNWDTAYTNTLRWDGGSTGLTAATGRTSLGGTTVGQNVFTLTNPGAVTFPRFNVDNTVSALDAATFRTAIGAGTSSTTGTVTSVSGTAPISVATGTSTPAISISAATTLAAGSMSSTDKTKLDGIASGATANAGTVTSVGGTGTVSGLSLSGTVTSTGNLTLGGTLAVTASNFASQTANTFLSAPSGVAGVPTFRAIVAADIPTLNQNTTGSSGSCTGNAATATNVAWSGVTSKPTTLAGYGITDGGGGFPAGTVMLFVQTAAPTGWTKSTTHDNKALRVVSGTAGSGGTSAFTTAFASRTPAGSVSSSFSSGSAASTTATGSISVSGGSVSATTLTTTQIPSHNHEYSTTWGSNYNSGQTVNNGTSAASAGTGTLFTASIGSSGGGTSHTHGFTNPSASFTGTAHTHTVSGSVSSSFSGTAMDFAVQYVDVIIATKN